MSKFQLLLLQSLRKCSLQSGKEMVVSKEIYDRRYWTLISDGPKKRKTPKFCAVCGESAFFCFPDFENGSIVRGAYFCDLHNGRVKKIRMAPGMEDKLLYDIVKQLKNEE